MFWMKILTIMYFFVKKGIVNGCNDHEVLIEDGKSFKTDGEKLEKRLKEQIKKI